MRKLSVEKQTWKRKSCHTEETKDKMRKNHWSRTHPEEFNKFISNHRPNNPTIYEDLFYELIRHKTDVIRQKKVGTYCCDFYLPEFNLIVEIDGYTKLCKRDEFIKKQGYNIIHFTNDDVLKYSGDITLPPKPELSLCLCGCGQRVSKSKNSFIIHHHLRIHNKDIGFIEMNRKRLKVSMGGINHPMYGKHHSDKVRRAISEAKVGKKLNLSTEGRKNLSDSTTKRNLINNPSKRPEVKDKLRILYEQRVTLPNRPY